MLGLFKVNDPYRLAAVLILILAIRLPLLWSGIPLITPELKWLLIGEKLADGGLIYRDLWDHIGPFSALVYEWLHRCFGRTDIPFKVLSIVITFIQAGIFNLFLLRNKAFNANTYVPALIYVFAMHISFDFMTLSPILMGMTFVLLAINNLFKRMDNTTRDDLFLHMGIYLGVATLFYQPFFLYFIVIIVSLLLFTGSIIRRMLLMVYGYFLVISLVGFYFYWFDSWSMFRIAFLESAFIVEPVMYITTSELIIISLIPFCLLVYSIFKTYQLGRYINYQLKIQRVMLFFLFSGIASLFLTKEFTAYQLIYFVPGLAFFGTHYLLGIKKWYIAELNTLTFTGLILIGCLFPLKNWLYVDRFVNFENLSVQTSSLSELIEGKSIWVTGNDIDLYQSGKLATPYLNWDISRQSLNNTDYYDHLTEIYLHMKEDMPEVIVDNQGIIPQLFEKLPTINMHYQKLEGFDRVYQLKSN